MKFTLILLVPKLTQYPLKPKAKEGLKPIFERLLSKGLLRPHSSSVTLLSCHYTSRIDEDLRSFLDLKAINKMDIPYFPAIPNPNTILLSILLQATYFTVIDFCFAFFGMPLHQRSQYLLLISAKHK